MANITHFCFSIPKSRQIGDGRHKICSVSIKKNPSRSPSPCDRQSWKLSYWHSLAHLAKVPRPTPRIRHHTVILLKVASRKLQFSFLDNLHFGDVFVRGKQRWAENCFALVFRSHKTLDAKFSARTYTDRNVYQRRSKAKGVLCMMMMMMMPLTGKERNRFSANFFCKVIRSFDDAGNHESVLAVCHVLS